MWSVGSRASDHQVSAESIVAASGRVGELQATKIEDRATPSAFSAFQRGLEPIEAYEVELPEQGDAGGLASPRRVKLETVPVLAHEVHLSAHLEWWSLAGREGRER